MLKVAGRADYVLKEGAGGSNSCWKSAINPDDYRCMIRSILRSIGLILLAAAFVFFIYDGTKSIADQTVYVSKFSQTWAEIHQQSLQSLQAMVEKSAGWLWTVESS